MELRAEDVHFSYAEGDAVLAGETFVFRSGVPHVLWGPNGAGKTTLLHVLAGLLRPARGAVLVDGAPVTVVDVALVPATPPVFEMLTVDEHCTLVAELWGLPNWRQYRARVEQFMLELGLERTTARVGNFSLGMRYKLYLALMLARDVPVLLLDEPFTALDAGSVDRAVDLTRKRAVESVVVLSTHQGALADQLSAHVTRIGENHGH